MTLKNLGLILLVAGILMIIYTGFHFITTEKVAEIGPLKINKDNNHFISWSPVVGVVLLGAGILLTFANRKKV